MQEITNQYIEKIIDSLSEEMKIAISVGCEIEHEIDGDKCIIKTKYPVSIKKQEDGKIIVHEIHDATHKLIAVFKK
jgi:hypothetical protein